VNKDVYILKICTGLRRWDKCVYDARVVRHDTGRLYIFGRPFSNLAVRLAGGTELIKVHCAVGRISQA